MAATFVFARNSAFGDSEFFAGLDSVGEYTEEQYARLREIFCNKINSLIVEYDPSLTWFHALSEVWGVMGETESDPQDFLEWWKSGADGKFENALLASWAELDSEIERSKAE